MALDARVQLQVLQFRTTLFVVGIGVGRSLKGTKAGYDRARSKSTSFRVGL